MPLLKIMPLLRMMPLRIMLSVRIMPLLGKELRAQYIINTIRPRLTEILLFQ